MEGHPPYRWPTEKHRSALCVTRCKIVNSVKNEISITKWTPKLVTLSRPCNTLAANERVIWMQSNPAQMLFENINGLIVRAPIARLTRIAYPSAVRKSAVRHALWAGVTAK